MKIETREITTTKEVYIADDGRVFEDKDQCLDYEFDSIKESLNCYDDKFKKTNIDDCIFVELVTKEDVDKFLYVGDQLGFTTDGIDGTGLYIYGCGDEWVNMDNAIAHIRGGINDEQC